MKFFPTVVIALCALGFVGFGLWLLADPAALEKVGIQATSQVGTVELRAFYGGMELGLGIFLALCLWRPQWQSAGLWLVLLTNGGAGLARLLAVGMGGVAVEGYLGWALLWELGFAALAGLALALKPT